MKQWDIWSYTDEAGRNDLADWYHAIPPEAQAVADARLDFLEFHEDWYSKGHAVEMERDLNGFTQIYVDVVRKERTASGKTRDVTDNYRLLGVRYSDPTRKRDGTFQPGFFVLFVGFQKWTRCTNPPDARERALIHKQSLCAGRGIANELSL